MCHVAATFLHKYMIDSITSFFERVAINLKSMGMWIQPEAYWTLLGNIMGVQIYTHYNSA